MHVRVCSVAVVVTLIAGVGACGKHLYGRDDLDVTVFQHLNNLRWDERLGNAALTVAPDMRQAFLSTWTARLRQIELQDVAVAGVSMNPSGDGADIVVNITYVERDTMTVKTTAITEHWVRTDDGWLADKPAAPDF